MGRHRARWLLLAGPVILALLAACAAPAPAAPTAPAPAARQDGAVHAAYLDLNGNIGDLRARVTDWQKGDAASLNIAVEKAERIETLLAHVRWPEETAAPVATVREYLPRVLQALKAKDAAALKKPLAAISEASHDLTHGFYDRWLATSMGAQSGAMRTHLAYLDLSANVSDLRTRVAEWQQGAESSLNIAVEKADRIGVLLARASWPDALAAPTGEIRRVLPAVKDALKAKDPAVVKEPLAKLAEASHDLTHDFYERWMAASARGSDATCVHASYLDLSRNVGELRARAADWQKGDAAGLSAALERMERVDAVLAHVAWPDALAGSVAALRKHAEPLAKALKAKDVAAAKEPLAAMGEASHDLTHDFYDKWARVPMGEP